MENMMPTQIELAVEMHNPQCAKKVEAALNGLEGIKNVTVNSAKQSVIVEGDVMAEKVKKTIEQKTGMSAVIMGLGSSSNKNLGSAVAAIAIGDSSVRGLLRMTQTDSETCVIEGSLDGLPVSDNLYVSFHESGDLTQGCHSCGPPFGYDATNKQYAGIISRLEPDEDKSAQFRCKSSLLNVMDLYGLSVVVHSGDVAQIKENQSNRLACGIVARSSGMFQNSKRFCACDGVSIWEEKKRGDGLTFP